MMNSLYGYEGYGGWMSFGPILWILFWGVILYLVIVGIRQSNVGGDTSLDILKKRYAKGEITKEEFEAMKKDLM